ncbi:sensor histidine kinase [Desulfovibrio ferrophilus]|uniref:histidine kinase n=1 Tax=Desulfovibrio ferrophilus TaxID=241368 RepID=A0A2Z6AY95_9BACT|nr:PAS domain-containing sensor histidine kinase [Desulfovibrio ferrophilus]BBD08163.1 ATPase/histidine kinase/DNA gyrase B/HSP90 domain protein [Desulfovibrio ferrophilus]
MNLDMYKDVRKTLLAVMILVPLVPFLASLTIGYSSYRESMENAALNTTKRIAADHATLISSFLEERRVDLSVILTTVEVADLNAPEKLKDLLGSLQRASRAFMDLGLINEQGIQEAYAGPFDLKGKDYSQASWFKNTLESGSHVSDIYLGYRHRPHFTVAVAAIKGDVKWVLRATVDQGLFGNLVQGVSIGETGEAYIVNRDGVLQTKLRSGGDILMKDTSLGSILEIRGNRASRTDEYIYATATLNYGMWLLVVRQKTEEAFQELDWASLLIACVCAAGGALIVGLAFIVSGRVVGLIRSKEQARFEMENHLMRAARLAELGEMSAGFAHEINNPLQIMKSEIMLMSMTAEADKPEAPINHEAKIEVLDGLRQIDKQIDRCATITRSILKFGRNSEPENTVIKLDEFLAELCAMIKRKAQVSGIDFSCTVPGNTPSVVGDAGQLQQVMLNLMNNALQAIVERHGTEGGMLKVATLADDRGHVSIFVEDNGAGIPPENMERIFNPFFTTKPPGKGTGLGLSVCHAILSAMNGSINVISKQGEGTIFKVSLPVGR